MDYFEDDQRNNRSSHRWIKDIVIIGIVTFTDRQRSQMCFSLWQAYSLYNAALHISGADQGRQHFPIKMPSPKSFHSNSIAQKCPDRVLQERENHADQEHTRKYKDKDSSIISHHELSALYIDRIPTILISRLPTSESRLDARYTVNQLTTQTTIHFSKAVPQSQLKPF